MNPLARLLPQRDVADQFNVSERTLVRWRSEREFPAPHRIGKRNYYLLQELTDWVDAQINNEKAITFEHSTIPGKAIKLATSTH